MSRETLQTLNTQTLIGFTDKRGRAWHYRADLQNGEGNHYPQAVPFQRAENLLTAWEVIESPVIAMVPCDLDDESLAGIDGKGMPFKYVQDDDRKALVRSDTGQILGVHSDRYAVHSYSKWLLNNVSNLLGDTLQIGSCGLLRRGAQAWVQIESPENLTTPQGVTYRPHLLAVSSLDGTLATMYRRAITAVVCDNTLSAALGEQGSSVFRVKHTRNSELRIKDARDALGIVTKTAEAFEAEVAELCATTVTDVQWFKFLDEITPIPDEKGRGRTIAENKRETLTSMYRRDERCAPWNGTAFGVLQTVNTWTHHEQTVKKVSRWERNTERAMTGEIDKVDRETVSVLAKVLAR